MTAFASRIIDWHRCHGRHDLPWQSGRDPYRVWLSEIMLQQTQVATVIPYFERFVARFPDLETLAAASDDAVLALWSGLGYYSRARNLLAAARTIMASYGGVFPREPRAIERLPGVGRSTAAAVAALAFGVRGAILDGNVKRVLARHQGIPGWPGDKAVEAALWEAAESRLPEAGIEAYTQGMMDLGALVCTRARPACGNCPVRSDCVARVQARWHELPAPRPKRTLPERRVQMLLVLERGELMLEKRAPNGVWGGLWSLPELPADADPAARCRDHYGFVVQSQQALPGLRHGFTHFRLWIDPVRIELAARPAAAAGQVWLTLDDALDAALPTPVRTLVEAVRRV